MATETVDETGSDERRNEVALHAAAQIEGLLRMLRREHDVADTTHYHEIFCSTLHRINQLNSVVISVVGDDDSRTLAEMEGVVHG